MAPAVVCWFVREVSPTPGGSREGGGGGLTSRLPTRHLHLSQHNRQDAKAKAMTSASVRYAVRSARFAVLQDHEDGGGRRDFLITLPRPFLFECRTLAFLLQLQSKPAAMCDVEPRSVVAYSHSGKFQNHRSEL